jgi:nitrogen fixation/metabolism regulation signal transduction histidine kinase
MSKQSRLIGALARRTLRTFLPGTTEWRLVAVVLVTAIVPLVVALVLVSSLFQQASSVWFDPKIGRELDRGVEVYKDYVKAVKDDLGHQTAAISADETLREAAKKRNPELAEAELDALFPRFPSLVSLTVEDADKNVLARRDRGRPVNDATERSLERRMPLTDEPDGATLVAEFAVDRKRLDELEKSGEFLQTYHELEASRGELSKDYLNAFKVLIALTALVTTVLGIILARGVTKRINRLGLAINLVAQGDLSVRVPVTGSDELTEVARSFNRMMAEIAQSRARLEYLQRMASWQEMAQRLAHEIKNPLTPIQLAVEQCHQKYVGEDPKFRQLLDTTLEIVEEEVGTLRRLVENFGNFARLPTAELKLASLRDFLRDCRDQLGHLEDPSLGSDSPDAEPIPTQNVDIDWALPKESLPAAIDRQMLRRVIVNLVRNSVQAIRDERASKVADESMGHVRVSAEKTPAGVDVIVEDDGPGIGEEQRVRVFDPYFTTKTDGTGLGLAIVKKIVVEHGGEIEVGQSGALGGARFVLHLPGPEALEAAAARKQVRERAIEQGVSTSNGA